MQTVHSKSRSFFIVVLLRVLENRKLNTLNCESQTPPLKFYMPNSPEIVDLKICLNCNLKPTQSYSSYKNPLKLCMSRSPQIVHFKSPFKKSLKLCILNFHYLVYKFFFTKYLFTYSPLIMPRQYLKLVHSFSMETIFTLISYSNYSTHPFCFHLNYSPAQYLLKPLIHSFPSLPVVC
jgi:hypothetical protein